MCGRLTANRMRLWVGSHFPQRSGIALRMIFAKSAAWSACNTTLRALATAACLLFPVTGRAAQPYEPVHPDPILERWRWSAFSELNGLGLRCLAEARDGAIWFGTDSGVRRYDGVNWTA